MISSLMAVRYIHAHTQFSFQDEYVYVDAVDKAMRGVLNRQNAMVDDYTARSLVCRGVEQFPSTWGECDQPIDPDRLPYRGYSTASIHSPLYFFLTALLAKCILFMSPGTDMMDAARLTGALWLGLGLSATWYLLRALNANRVVTLTVSLLLLASPHLRWSNFYVTPDSFSLLAGSLTMLACLKMLRRQWSPWTLVVTSSFIGTYKVSMVFAKPSRFLFTLLHSLNQDNPTRDTWKKKLLWSLCALAFALVFQFGYQKVRALIALPFEGNESYDTKGDFSLLFATEQTDNFLSYLYLGPAASTQYAGVPHAPTVLASILLTSALVSVSLFKLKATPETTQMSQASLIGLVTLGPLFYMYISWTTGSLFELAPRYGEALFPGLAVGTAGALADRKLQTPTLLFAIAVLLFALYTNDVR